MPGLVLAERGVNMSKQVLFCVDLWDVYYSVELLSKYFTNFE